MNFEYISDNAEHLLSEIIEKNDVAGYWDDRFDNLSSTQDTELRDSFKELKEAGMITAVWASNVPYSITILNKGKNYFDLKTKYEKEQKKLSIREWKIAIVSAAVGALVGLIPTIISVLGGM